MDYKDLKLYSFTLPKELIARFPANPPDSCRLLVSTPKEIQDAYFYELANFLTKGDLLIANDTVVEKRRVFLKRKTGSRIEAIFLDEENPGEYIALVKKASKLKEGEILYSEKNPEIEFMFLRKEKKSYLRLISEKRENLFEEIGQMPIPPYLKREEKAEDRIFYQNFFAKSQVKSAAAPTAALHFTPRVMESLSQKGVKLGFVSLSISYGTFAPLRQENFTKNKLYQEYYSLPQETAKLLQERNYKRLIAVGTTSLRVLETVYRKSNGKFHTALQGFTDLFLHPPDKVYSVDGLITNFHLPESSLLLLVACMIDREKLLSLYEYAISQKYRFYSYGDAMLILTR